jgi:hypothetical protein
MIVLFCTVGVAPVFAQAQPHIFIIPNLTYPNGSAVPSANLSFHSWLSKVSGYPVPEIATETSEGCGISDTAGFQLWVECSFFGDFDDSDSWWVPGDTIYVTIYAANDPVTSETDSVTVYDILLGGSENNPQYFGTDPLAVPVELTSFSGQRLGDDVLITWSVASELDNLGFYVHRGLSNEGPFDIISELIPGRGTSNEAWDYSWTDEGPDGRVLYYMLEDVSFTGRSDMHGPIRVIMGSTSSWGSLKTEFTD